MCGIAGIFAYASSARPVRRAELCAIRDHMVARGPDGAGEWYGHGDRVGLAHRRLAIIDLSERGAQPMLSRDGRLAITFNGEIYNYRELKHQLQQQGCVFASDTDTEVLLHLYATKGEAMLHDLRGMFAFAIWDARDSSLFMARDAFGIKPLYYADDGKTIRFASQVKALLEGAVDTAPEPAGHAGFFLWGAVPSPWTLYRGIKGLEAGNSLRVSADGSVQIREWTSVHAIIQNAIATPPRGDRNDAVHVIAAAIRDSVAAHMVADVPVGVFLSSGLDSCMLAAGAAATHPDVRAMTLGFREFEGTIDDEVPLARDVARSLGVAHDVYAVSRKDFVTQRTALLDAMDQPSIDGVNTWFVAKAAAKSGLKVALSGLGGDEIFASYPSFVDVPRMHKLARRFSGLPQIGRGFRTLTAPIAAKFASPKFASVLEYGSSFGGAYLLRRGLMMPWELGQVLDPDFAREGVEKLQTERELGWRIDGIAPDRFRVSSLEMSMYMRNQLLRDSDWAGMAQSVELRVPFVDTTFLQTVAPWLAAFPDLTKPEIAAASAPGLPAAVWNRPKTGFSVPVREWLLADLPDDNSRGLRGWGNRVYKVQTSADPKTTTGAVFGGGAAERVRAPKRKRVLISTIAPGSGGVHMMTEFVVKVLREEGLEPVIAHYEPYSVSPSLSVPSYKLLTNRLRSERRQSHNGCETHAIGAWLPELEFTHYYATAPWREVMDSCDAFVAASGNDLAATPFQQTQRPYVAWVATDWAGDRVDRARRFSAPRRVLDQVVNAPVIRRLEKRLLEGGTVLSLSEHTRRELQAIAPGLQSNLLPVPIDTDAFFVDSKATITARIGFAGRFDDPRKNIGLLLEAFAIVHRRFPEATLSLMGGTGTDALRAAAERLGIGESVQVARRLNDKSYRAELQTLDVFVVPSHQEGLCIAALEAMACGVPVVSTRCGGPEEFVVDDVTGICCDFDPHDLAKKVLQIVSERTLRQALGANARTRVQERYSWRSAAATFLNGFYGVFPDIQGDGRTSLPTRAARPGP